MVPSKALPNDRIGILGAGRQALETSGYCAELGITTAFFVEEVTPSYDRDPKAYGAPILSLEDDLGGYADIDVVAAVGSHEVRRRLVESWPGHRFMTLVSKGAWVADDATIGIGTTVAPLAAVNRCASVGAYVLVNVGAILSHDVIVGDYSTVSPGCAIGGGARIGSDVFIGIGATVIDHVTLGDGAYVAAGAVVVDDVDQRVTVMGVPARPSPRSAS